MEVCGLYSSMSHNFKYNITIADILLLIIMQFLLIF